MKKISLFFACIAVGILTSACSDKKESGPSLEDAVGLFADQDYEAALAMYINLIPKEGSSARVGAGWCELRLHSYSDAVSYFEAAAADSLPDGYAGWSFALWALDQPSPALQKASVVLTKQPNFTLSLDTKIKAEHLIWIQASCYLELVNYSLCLQKIQLLDASFSPNLNDPNIANILLTKLETLGNADVTGAKRKAEN